MKSCLDCRYCYAEDLYDEFCCKKKNGDLCPRIVHTIFENGKECIDSEIYPACEEYVRRKTKERR